MWDDRAYNALWGEPRVEPIFRQNENHSRWDLALGMAPNSYPTPDFFIADNNNLVSEMPRGPNLNPCQPNPNPNVNRGNMVVLDIFHVHGFMLFVYFSFALAVQHQHGFWWNMGSMVHISISPHFFLFY